LQKSRVSSKYCIAGSFVRLKAKDEAAWSASVQAYLESGSTMELNVDKKGVTEPGRIGQGRTGDDTAGPRDSCR
jgi:hypothetical protein